MTGGLLALLSAAIFGLTSAALRRGVLRASVLQGLWVTVPLGVPLFLLACWVSGAFSALAAMSSASVGWMVVAGVIHFVVGRYGNYRSTRALGAAQSAPVQQISGLVSLTLALIFLGEYLTPLRVLGILLVLSGPAIILRQRAKAGEVRTRSGAKLNYVEGYFWGAVCAIAWGISPLLIRFGLEDGGVLVSIAGGLISYASAAVAIVLIVLLAGNLTHVRAIEGGSTGWFLASGTLTFLSQMFRYMALAVAPVTVVAPILQTTTVFRMLFGWLINRKDEVFGASVLIGVALSTLGVIALSVSLEAVLDHIALPEPLAGFARLRWP